MFPLLNQISDFHQGVIANKLSQHYIIRQQGVLKSTSLVLRGLATVRHLRVQFKPI
jgi:hypothetical protein